jgi:uncharacterized glyoxalase superfamily protein PhnB
VLKQAIPVLHVRSATAAEEFYCNKLGFRRQFIHRLNESMPDPCYMGLARDDAQLHVSSFSGDGVSGGVVYLRVDDVDGLHATLLRDHIDITMEPTDQSWGNREMYVKDPDGNSLRFIQENRPSAAT